MMPTRPQETSVSKKHIPTTLKELKITSLKSSGGRCESGNMFSVLINKSCVVSVLMLAVDFITRPPLVKSGFIT